MPVAFPYLAKRPLFYTISTGVRAFFRQVLWLRSGDVVTLEPGPNIRARSALTMCRSRENWFGAARAQGRQGIWGPPIRGPAPSNA
ncbi:hypothetical protein VUR80DRAFT_3293 [Thermomyces stellatus]